MVRSKQRKERWNRLTRLFPKQEEKSNICKPFIPHTASTTCTQIVIKRIQHIPEKSASYVTNVTNHALDSKDMRTMWKKHKNWKRRQRRSNKMKKPLPSLLPGTKGDIILRKVICNVRILRIRFALKSRDSNRTICQLKCSMVKIYTK